MATKNVGVTVQDDMLTHMRILSHSESKKNLPKRGCSVEGVKRVQFTSTRYLLASLTLDRLSTTPSTRRTM